MIIILIAILLIGNEIDYLEEHYKVQVNILGLSGIPYGIWYLLANADSISVSIFEMEYTLLGKESTYQELNSAIFSLLSVYLVIAILSKLSQWTMAAAYGCVASIASACLIEIVDLMSKKISIPEIVVFIIPLIVSLIFMFIGFNFSEPWISEDHEILGLVVGIIPALVFTFITFCNIFTMAFDEAVVGKMGYVVLAIVLDVALYGVGIFMYYRFHCR